ncbi:MAG: DUF2617 family protein [Candidatus Bipolaricaulia bacterium]
MAKNLDYVDQSAKDLGLTLLEGNLDYLQFNILQEDGITRPNLKIKAGIIGTSNFLSIHSGNRSLHEVLACVEIKTDSLRAYHRFLNGHRESVELMPSDLSDQKLHIVSGLPDDAFWSDYKFHFWLKYGEAGLAELEHGEHMVCQAITHENQIGLVHRFQGKGQTQPPKTIVWLGLEGNLVHAKTVHSYPNEDLTLFTQSRIRINTKRESREGSL